MVQRGVLSKEKKFEFGKEIEVPFENAVAGKKLSIFDPIAKIESPLEHMVRNTYNYIKIAEQNSVAKKFVDLKNIKGGEKLNIFTAKEIKDMKAVPTGLKSITVFENGKAVKYKVDNKIAEVFTNLGSDGTQNMFVNMLKPFSSALRAGITLNPAFTAKNFFRDNITSSIQSRNGFVPFVDGLRGMASSFKKDKFYQKWIKAGGANSALVSMDRNYINQSVWKALQTSKVHNVIKTPLEGLRILNELTDNASRIGDFRKALAKGKPNDIETVLKAAFDSREVSLDFARIGAKTEALNQISAFFNARVGGYNRFYQAMKEQPQRAVPLAIGTLMIPSALLFFANKDDKRYQNLPEWEKDMYWHILTDKTIYRVPKPFEPGIMLGGLTERFLNDMLKEDKRGLDGLIENSGLTNVSSLLPTAISPFISNYTNTNLFNGAPIVPASRENMLPKYQYKPYTHELTKSISGLLLSFTEDEILGKQLNPLAIENFVNSWGGGLGKLILSSADKVLREVGVLHNPEKPAGEFEDLPIIKDFTVRYPSINTKAMQEFYKNYNKNTKSIQTFKKLIKEEGKISEAMEVFNTRQQYFLSLNKSKRAISNLSAIAKAIQFSETMDAEEKRQAIDSIYIQANKIAETANKQSKQWEQIIKQQKGNK